MISEIIEVRCRLIVTALLGTDCLPHQCESLIKAEFLPHFKALLPSHSSSFNEAVDVTVRESILVSCIIESGC